MIEALRLLGRSERRSVVERVITARGLPPSVTVAAAQAIGHVGGHSDDRFWQRLPPALAGANVGRLRGAGPIAASGACASLVGR